MKTETDCTTETDKIQITVTETDKKSVTELSMNIALLIINLEKYKNIIFGQDFQ